MVRSDGEASPLNMRASAEPFWDGSVLELEWQLTEKAANCNSCAMSVLAWSFSLHIVGANMCRTTIDTGIIAQRSVRIGLVDKHEWASHHRIRRIRNCSRANRVSVHSLR